MTTYEVANLKPEDTFRTNLMLDSQFLICPSNCHLGNEVLKALKEWQFTQVYCEEETQQQSAPSEKKEKSPEEKKEAAKEKIASFETEEVSSQFIEQTENPALKKIKEEIHIATADFSKIQTDDPIILEEAATRVYNSYMSYINQIYQRYATHRELNYDEIYGTVGLLCDFVAENQNIVLRISPSQETYTKNVIVSHSMISTVLAITIGYKLKMTEGKIRELGTACLLHEIGQIKISPHLYMNNRVLTPAEKAQINTHPIMSYNILKEAKFPLSLQLAVLEHHERENGTGYPRHITGEKITTYSKIIAVACSFEAITAPRQYKDERTTYAAMIELLRNEGNPYDPIVLKALLLCLSIFPIGSYVYLSNGKIAQVVDVNDNDPKNPIVKIHGETDEYGKAKILKTSDSSVKVVRALDKKGKADFLSSVKNQSAE